MAKNYIPRLSVSDVVNYARSQGIVLTNSESIIIYNYIRDYGINIIYGDISSFSILKKQIKPDLYNKIIELYEENKNKYLK